MWISLFFTLLGGVLSWLITHWYFRITEKRVARENPIHLLERVSADVSVIKQHIETHGPIDPTLRYAIDKSQRSIEHVKYVFRAAIHNWFSEFTSLKYIVKKGDFREIEAQITQMDAMMKSMTPGLRDAALDNTIDATTFVNRPEDHI